MNQPVKSFLEAHPFFRGMNAEHISMMLEGASEREFMAGDFLFRAGEPANKFFFILDGTIAIESSNRAGARTIVQSVGGGEVLGWSWLYPPFVWHLDARVIEHADCLVLDGAHLLIAAERDHDFGYDLMKRVAQVLIQRLNHAARKLREPVQALEPVS